MKELDSFKVIPAGKGYRAVSEVFAITASGETEAVALACAKNKLLDRLITLVAVLQGEQDEAQLLSDEAEWEQAMKEMRLLQVDDDLAEQQALEEIEAEQRMDYLRDQSYEGERKRKRRGSYRVGRAIENLTEKKMREQRKAKIAERKAAKLKEQQELEALTPEEKKARKAAKITAAAEETRLKKALQQQRRDEMNLIRVPKITYNKDGRPRKKWTRQIKDKPTETL